MTGLLHDMQVALRGFRRTPAFAATILLILGITIGMAVAIFAAVDAILIRRLPVLDQDGIAVMWPYRVRGAELSPRLVDLDEIARASRMTHGTAGVSHWGTSLAPFIDGDRTLSLEQSLATANFFDVVGVAPAIGRLFHAEDAAAGAPHVAVLSHRAWIAQFGADRSVIGRHLVDPWTRDVVTIVGVAPAGFAYPVGTDCWTSLGRADTAIRMLTISRLAPGVSVEQARDEYFSIVSRLEPTWKLTGATAESFSTAMIGEVRPTLVALAVAVALLLAIACVNVGNLFLVRASSRSRELAIRRAIGASSGDLVRQLAVESGMLAVGGGTIGVAAAELFLSILIKLAPPKLPRLDELQVHANVLIVALAVTAVAVVCFGIVPAFVSARVDPALTLRHDSRSGGETGGRRRVRDGLVMIQMAVAVIMLIAAGLLARSFVKLMTLDLGYRTEHLSIMSVAYDPKSFAAADTTQGGQSVANVAIDEQFEARMLAIPGVTAVTPLMTPPFLGAGLNVGLFEAEGQNADEIASNPTIPWELSGPQYFQTLGMSVLRGRGFLPTDRLRSEPVLVISAAVARRLWPGVNPIGKRMRFSPSAQKAGDPLPKALTEWRTVVGVVSDTHFRLLRESSPTVYVPWRQIPGMVWGNFAVRASGDAAATTAGIRIALATLGHSYALWSWRSLDDILAGPLAEPRLSALLLAAFGMASLALAGLGLYGVMSTAVRERTREIGIRVALGATPNIIRAGVVRRAMLLSALGGAGGLAVALVGTRFLHALLFEISPVDPATIVTVSAVLLLVAAAAAYLPAQRAMRVDPMEALRSD